MNKIILFFIILTTLVTTRGSEAAIFSNGSWKYLNEDYNNSNVAKNNKIIDGFFGIKLQDTYNHSSNNNKNEIYIKNKLGLNIKLSKHFSIRSLTILEEMNQQSANERASQLVSGNRNRSLRNGGGFIDELVLNYNKDRFSALMGKFRANFGNAWKASNGIWINDIAEEYEQEEKLGLGAIYRVGDKKEYGKYIFGFSAFTNDRKNLDNSIITKRNSNSKLDGISGDTRSLESYVASMDIYYDFGKEEELSYHFSYLNLAINDRQNNIAVDDSKAWALGMNYQYPINNIISLGGLIEYVAIDNFRGNINRNADLLSLNLTGYINNNFFLTLARSYRKEEEIGLNGIDEYINEFSFGYEFDKKSIFKGLLLKAGLKESEVDNKLNPIDTSSIGFIVKHTIEF